MLNKIADIAPPHRCLFITELADAAQKLSGSAVKELNTLSDADSIQISAGSMAGAAILRVLSALSALKALGVAKVGGKDGILNKEEVECISVIRDLNTNIEPLWQALSTCAIKIESRLITSPSSSPGTALTTFSGGSAAVMPPLSPGTQRLLPFIEGFFILCDKLRSSPASQVNNELLTATACEIKEIESSASTSEATSLQLTKADDKGVTFIRFADKHRRLLNLFVRQNPGLLEKSLSLLLKVPRLIDFDNKRAYFKSRIRHQHEQQTDHAAEKSEDEIYLRRHGLLQPALQIDPEGCENRNHRHVGEEGLPDLVHQFRTPFLRFRMLRSSEIFSQDRFGEVKCDHPEVTNK